MATIDHLPSDVLREIFSYIKVVKRQKLSYVCKKWQSVNQLMLRSMKKLVCHCEIHFNSSVVTQYDDMINFTDYIPDKFEVLLRRFCDHVKEVEILGNTPCFFSTSFWEAFALCTKLTYARFLCYTSGFLNEFLIYLPTDNLENLSIENRETHDEFNPDLQNYIIEVLTKAKKLKTIDICRVPMDELRSIGGLDNLQSLYIKVMKPLHLSFGSMKLPNLETIVIEGSKLDDVIISELVTKCENLHTVSLITENLFCKATLKEIMKLPNLRNIRISPRFLFDEDPSITKDVISVLLQRSKNLKTFYFYHDLNYLFNDVIREAGYNCDQCYDHRYYEWITHHAMLRDNSHYEVRDYTAYPMLDYTSVRLTLPC
ncbi:hypothetical protein PV328_004478 [Microctonus aethiopoides]|uniref:F-box domain-containing protein n=1 Tax=Microctonus aethiopoides TaxID=144406 RepID=A0AA39FAP9_9HYME|nr:hypothetical protein PV328_004478 [Microctonus aethiopoides]